MESLSLKAIARLAHPSEALRASLFLPTRHFGPGSQEEDTTRLRNLLRTAESALAAGGLRSAEVDAILAPGMALLDDRPFWLRSRDGIALFLAPGEHEVYQVDFALPEAVHVGHAYRVRPLLPLLGRRDEYWVLALSQKRVRLLRGDAAALADAPAEGIPESLSDALQWEDFEKASLQFHTGYAGTGGRAPAVFHGTGEVDVKKELVQFFREIDHGLREHLGESTAPLVLAGVDYLLPLYREVNTYSALADGTVAGNPDSLGDAALHEKSWIAAAEMLGREKAALFKAVAEQWASSRVTTDPETIVGTAAAGRIETMLLSSEAGWWVRESGGPARVITGRESGESDLLERAALDTLEHGGRVITVSAAEMPHAADAIAMLRY